MSTRASIQSPSFALPAMSVRSLRTIACRSNKIRTMSSRCGATADTGAGQAMLSEFDLITRYFNRPTRHTVLGVGDDAALLALTPGHELAASTDTMVEGVHFFPDAEPDSLGHKALAVNLSDLAAMGATPKWAMLALTIPKADETWLEDFARGFFALAAEHDVDLIGGDTARGPRNICVQIMGEVPHGRALRRNGAKVGDDVWVSGHIGDAAAAASPICPETQTSTPTLAPLRRNARPCGTSPMICTQMLRGPRAVSPPIKSTSCSAASAKNPRAKSSSQVSSAFGIVSASIAHFGVAPIAARSDRLTASALCPSESGSTSGKKC